MSVAPLADRKAWLLVLSLIVPPRWNVTSELKG